MKIEIFFLCQLFATFFMTGVIWIVQVVHYPSFEFIEKDKQIDFAIHHQKNISFVVLPLMVVELFSGFILYLRVTDSPRVWEINFFLIILTWVCTFLIQVPIHQKMTQGFDQKLVRKLVHSNWIRTFLWTLRSSIFLICLAYFSIG